MPLTPADYRKIAYIHRTGVYADIPSAADVLAGTLYFATDVPALYRSNGATWDDYYDVGNWQNVAFDASDYTAAGSMVWTVDSGDILDNAYVIIGKTLIWSIRIATSTLSGVASANLFIVTPEEITSGLAPTSYINDAGATPVGIIQRVSSTLISIGRIDGANFSLQTNSLYIYFTLIAQLT